MKYLKSCLPKGNLLDTTFLLIPTSFIEIVDETRILQFQCHQILWFSYPFSCMVLIAFIIFLIYKFILSSNILLLKSSYILHLKDFASYYF